MKTREQEKNDDPHRLELSSLIPPQFLLLCQLMEVEPDQVVRDFLSNVGMENYGLGEPQRSQAMEYFLCCGYGQHFYIEADLRKILRELEAISSLFPNDGSRDLIDFHARWRDRYYNYWFQKWYKKVRRKQ